MSGCHRLRPPLAAVDSAVQARLGRMTLDANEDVERNDFVEDGTALDESVERRKKKRKKHLMKEAADAERRGVCYLSRVPPRMDPTKLRQIFSQYGEILRIYLAPEDPKAQLRRKQSGGFRGQEFSEGWVEFTKRTVAKRVAEMLNGEQIGGKKRSSFYYDLWNIKYLRKFKWDDLTEEIAYKKATRDQKLALELAAARRQSDFYLSKVDKSRAISAIQEKRLKKIKGNAELTMTTPDAKSPDIVTERPRTVRKFRQTQPLADTDGKYKQELSRDVLLGVFGSQ